MATAITTKHNFTLSSGRVFVIHAPPPELPMFLIKGNSKSWAELHKGKKSKRDRRK